MVGAVQDVPRSQLALYGLAIVAVALIGARYLQGQAGGGAARAAAPRAHVRLERSRSQSAYVHVTGAVRRPGVYRLPGWARLEQAVRRAGGAARGADLEGVNLAAKISDGQQVVVPRKGGVPQVVAGSGGSVGEAGAPESPISLNTATPEQLDQLDGVGPATAQKILAWRKQHGGFSSIDDLKQISGIGPKRFEALKEKVRI
jgi:competence protein ComEA